MAFVYSVLSKENTSWLNVKGMKNKSELLQPPIIDWKQFSVRLGIKIWLVLLLMTIGIVIAVLKTLGGGESSRMFKMVLIVSCLLALLGGLMGLGAT